MFYVGTVYCVLVLNTEFDTISPNCGDNGTNRSIFKNMLMGIEGPRRRTATDLQRRGYQTDFDSYFIACLVRAESGNDIL